MQCDIRVCRKNVSRSTVHAIFLQFGAICNCRNAFSWIQWAFVCFGRFDHIPPACFFRRAQSNTTEQEIEPSGGRTELVGVVFDGKCVPCGLESALLVWLYTFYKLGVCGSLWVAIGWPVSSFGYALHADMRTSFCPKYVASALEIDRRNENSLQLIYVSDRHACYFMVKNGSKAFSCYRFKYNYVCDL